MASQAPGLWQRFAAWCQRNLPTRESMENSRLLRPVAHRVLAPHLWRFTRRSVPRGVALGMVTGILFPVAQIPFSALLALPLRANIPAAALTTFVTNPITTPPLWVAAYWIGKWALHIDKALPGDPVRDAVESGWMQWLLSDAAPATATGLLIVTATFAIGGYVLSALGWRLWIARKWNNRRIRNHD
ncbi:MAG: DUF2062 domain-containing protein [Candidatus Sphingomonas colombiensis]|nr:DUF2062 domain-containing protein [Sphingomonas sp.]WEK42879.1 MAG: DUF2062 domain-containing protein [Sphingomonas sp.]